MKNFDQKLRKSVYKESVVVSECSDNHFALRSTLLRNNNSKMVKFERDIALQKSLCNFKNGHMVNTFITDKAQQIYKVIECIDANSFLVKKYNRGDQVS